MALIIARSDTGTGPVRTGGAGAPGVPVQTTVILDGSGTPSPKSTQTKTFYLIADTNYYEDPTISFVDEEAGIDYKVSHDNATWVDSYTFADMNALAEDQDTIFYVKAEVINDGTGSQPATDTYTEAKMRLQATEYDHNPNT